MNPYTGKYSEHIRNNRWKSVYYTFTPRPLKDNNFYKIDDELASILSVANRVLGILDGMIIYMPDRHNLQELMLLKESYYSRLIDYHCCYFQEILKGISSNKTDAECFKNIKLAYNHSFGRTFSSGALSNICSIALYGAEAEKEIQIRKTQTFLSNVVTNLRIYNPTAPDNILPSMADISAFLSADDSTDILIKAALAHYQFEMLHPYECYNGIVGRIIISMILKNFGYEAFPYVCLSEFLYYNKNEYFDKLSSTQLSGGYELWIKFILRGICESAQKSIKRIKQYQEIIRQDETKIKSNKLSTNSMLAVYNYFKTYLISEISPAAEKLGLSFNTVVKSIERLCDMDILKIENNRSRHRLYSYYRIMEIFAEYDRA